MEMFLDWIESNGFEVVVFDMDQTMSSSHCGSGLLKEEMPDFISKASGDFIIAANMLRKLNFRCAIATGSDPAEYNLPGQSRDTHILGPDLATALIVHHCPEALGIFQIMVGYDCRLHAHEDGGDHGGDSKSVNNAGKRHHMRLIKQYYDVPFHKMVLFDDSLSSLVNEDGWVGIKVNASTGFRFSDLPSSLHLFVAARGIHCDVMALPTVNIEHTSLVYATVFGMHELSSVAGGEGDGSSLVMTRDAVQLGFAVTGVDPSGAGAGAGVELLVSDLWRARSELQSQGLEMTDVREEWEGGHLRHEFSVQVPDSGLHFCVYAHVPHKED